MYHNKFYEVATLIKAGVSVLLTGEKGSGKTTLIKNVAESLDLTFFSVSMTRQTTLSHLMGFMNVNGHYIPSQLRQAAENGGLVLLDEIDASDPNVILCLNTIENGYLAFPDKVVTLHNDFRLAATSNPQDNHKDYTGRARLDASTLDRFDIIHVDRDEDLEKSLVDSDIFIKINLIRKALDHFNSSQYVSMRDAFRFQTRKNLKLDSDFEKRLLSSNQMAYEFYLESLEKLPKFPKLTDCKTLQDVWEFVDTQQ